jgi:hypothetical protein
MARAGNLQTGVYTLATKYSDGDGGDSFAIGFYAGSYDHFGETRHLVVDKDGKQFRANGFRRVARIGKRRGAWIVAHFGYIEDMKDRFSVWHWYRAPWRILEQI